MQVVFDFLRVLLCLVCYEMYFLVIFGNVFLSNTREVIRVEKFTSKKVTFQGVFFSLCCAQWTEGQNHCQRHFRLSLSF